MADEYTSLDISSDPSLLALAEDVRQTNRPRILTYSDKVFSLADATSFALMERLRIRSAFTFDHHFAQ